MDTYKRVPIGDSDCFVAQSFPNLKNALFQIREQTKGEPLQETIEMVVSFVKEHWLDGKMLLAHPLLTAQLTSGALPISELERLFEASRNNTAFKTELEAYIRETLQAAETAHFKQIH
jgi:hypothetical protein